MTVVKLKPGEVVLVSAGDPNRPDHGLPPPQLPGTPPGPVDPGYGIDAGLGWLRPSHPIALPPPGKPTHPIVLPPEGPVDPSWGIDVDIGYVKPDNSLPQPQPPDVTPNWEVKAAWTPLTGWIVVAIPTGPTPTPSKSR